MSRNTSKRYPCRRGSWFKFPNVLFRPTFLRWEIQKRQHFCNFFLGASVLLFNTECRRTFLQHAVRLTTSGLYETKAVETKQHNEGFDKEYMVQIFWPVEF